MYLTSFSLKNPVAATLCYALVVLIGLVALTRMGRSILPPVSLPVVSVSAPYPGAAPSEIERLIVEPVEEEVRTLPDVSRVSSSAQNGIGTVTVQFRFGSDLEKDRTDVQNAVESARADMPPELVPPVVSRDDVAQASIFEEAISSELLSQTQLAEILNRDIVPALRATSGVGTVRTSGSVVRQFTVTPKLGALHALGATSLDVLRSVAAGNDLLPGGLLRSPVSDATIGIDASVTTASAIGELPVAIPGGVPARVRDVAEVSDGFADRSVISRVDGEDAVLIYVSHRSGADSIGTIEAVRRTIDRLAQTYPKVRFQQLRTDLPYTNNAIAGVLQTLGEGVVLTVLVMLVFLHAWRNALVAAISIPTSLCAAFTAMWAMGFSLNVLSLMGLSLTIGILVDDSIVIIEAIARAVERGLRGDAAALAGRKEIGGAAFAITFVDVAVFLPIGFMNGIVGEFMRQFALVVVLATAFSLFVSFTLTPLLAARWSLIRGGKPLDSMKYRQLFEELRIRSRTFPWTMRGNGWLRLFACWHAVINGFNDWEERTCTAYGTRWLPYAVRRGGWVLAAAAALFVVSLVPLGMGVIPSEFSPPVNRGEVMFDLTFPAGTPLAQTDAGTRRLVQSLLADPTVRHVETSSGRAFNGSTDVLASSVAELAVVLQDQNSNGADVERRVRSLGNLVPGETLAGAGKGMGGTPAVSYDVGGDSSVVDAAAARIAQVLRANPAAADVRTSDLGVQSRIALAVDPDKARLLRVSPDDAAQTARIASGGSIATKARLSSGLVDVLVQSNAAEHGDLDGLKRFDVRSAQGIRIPLTDLVDEQTGAEPTVIQRENGERTVSVSANAATGVPISRLTSSVNEVLRDPNFFPAGAHIEPRGDIAQFLDAVSRMLAALSLSVVAIYVALAILYRSYSLPLAIMLTVPMASIGAFGSLFVANGLHSAFPSVPLFAEQTLNLYSMLGIIMLVGLVAKNGILLVEYAERAVRDGIGAKEAITHAARARFRPILMTTFAMIAGMLPLALGHTIGAEYRKALGTVVIGGLSTSLLLTFFVVPVVYVWERERKKLRRPLSNVPDPIYSVSTVSTV